MHKKTNSQIRIVGLLLITLLLWGCAGRKTGDGKPGKTPPSARVPKQSIALVIGGAGIASFATVGLLKKFREEGIEVSYIVTTGWPSLFALGYGFFKSIHDFEWFAMRLNQKDFYRGGLFDFKKGFANHNRISAKVSKAFKQSSLGQTRIPIVITATNTRRLKSDVYQSGGWQSPLLKAMSLPGIFRPYPHNSQSQWVLSLDGIDVDEATKRGADVVVAVNMYDDYFDFLKQAKHDSSESVFRQLYLTQLRGRVQQQLSQAQFKGNIYLRKSPSNFGAKRKAIHAGYLEGTRLVRELRSRLME